MIESPELLGCILSTENGLRMMYWASRSMLVPPEREKREGGSSRLRGGTRWLRWMLNPECVHPRNSASRTGRYGRVPAAGVPS